MRLIEPPGNDQLQYHDEFAAITASEFGAAMSGNPVDFAMLRSRGNLEAYGVAFEELDLQGGPERCLRKGDWGDGHEVVLVTLELFMFLDRDDATLFGYFETPDLNAAREGMAALEVNTLWQSEMENYFEALEGLKPDEGFKTLESVFFLA